jgi:hypothetical protein
VKYSGEAAKKIKVLEGYTSQHLGNEGENVRVDWETESSTKVKCMPGGYDH